MWKAGPQGTPQTHSLHPRLWLLLSRAQARAQGLSHFRSLVAAQVERLRLCQQAEPSCLQRTCHPACPLMGSRLARPQTGLRTPKHYKPQETSPAASIEVRKFHSNLPLPDSPRSAGQVAVPAGRADHPPWPLPPHAAGQSPGHGLSAAPAQPHPHPSTETREPRPWRCALGRGGSRVVGVRLTSPPPCAGSAGPRRSGRSCPPGHTCPPGRRDAAAWPRALGRQDRGWATGTGLQRQEGGRGQHAPWQSRVYSGRFRRAVCATSKSRLPRQYMNVGKKSAAMLRRHVLSGYLPSSPRRPGSRLHSRAHSQAPPFSSSLPARAAHLGLFWMERRARLKARLRHASSSELMSRWRLVCGAGAGEGCDREPCCPGTSPQSPGSQPPDSSTLANTTTTAGNPAPQAPPSPWPALGPQTRWRVPVLSRAVALPWSMLNRAHPPTTKGFPARAHMGFSMPASRCPARAPTPQEEAPLTNRKEAQDLGSPPGHLVYVTQNLQQICGAGSHRGAAAAGPAGRASCHPPAGIEVRSIPGPWPRSAGSLGAACPSLEPTPPGTFCTVLGAG